MAFRLSGLVLALYLTGGLFCYLLAPDAEVNANVQMPVFARKPPGFVSTFVVVRVGERSGSWLTGYIDESRYFPARPGTFALRGDTAIFVDWDGFEQKILGGRWCERVHWLGTDLLGRDVLSRMLIGCRTSVGVGLAAALASLILGVGVGATAGFWPGRWDKLASWVMSVVWAPPSFLWATTAAFALEKGFWSTMLAVAFSIWVEPARILRGQMRAAREKLYVQAARAYGAGSFARFFRHALPSAYGLTLILGAGNFSAAVLLEAGLSFLGLGTPPPTPSWGAMVFEGYPYLSLQSGVHLALAPGLAISLLCVSGYVFTEHLRRLQEDASSYGRPSVRLERTH
jgi:peptide/nickel transport system permease protein